VARERERERGGGGAGRGARRHGRQRGRGRRGGGMGVGWLAHWLMCVAGAQRARRARAHNDHPPKHATQHPPPPLETHTHTHAIHSQVADAGVAAVWLRALACQVLALAVVAGLGHLLLPALAVCRLCVCERVRAFMCVCMRGQRMLLVGHAQSWHGVDFQSAAAPERGARACASMRQAVRARQAH
jgi:hypothetical protein